MTRGRPRTGTIEKHGDHLDVRPTLADGSRGARVCLPKGTSKAAARERARALTELAARKGTTRQTAAPVPTGPLLRDWADAWLDDRRQRGLTSVEDDAGRLRKWVLGRLTPPLGARPIQSIATRDLKELVQDLDANVRAGLLSWKTARNTWGAVSKMFDDACHSKTLALCVREDNPALGVRPPDEGPRKAKAYLYPSEFLALVSCERVPIRWRRLFALAVYTYCREGELEALEYYDVDLVHGVIHVHRSVERRSGAVKNTKTNRPRIIPVEPALLPLLRPLREQAERRPGDRLFPMPPACDLSPRLRQYLRWAGVARPQLFANDATRKQITFHDLRATGITWMALRGDDPLRIMQRAGHEDFATTQGYIREAERFGEVGNVAPFPSLPSALILPEKAPETAHDWCKLRGKKG